MTAKTDANGSYQFPQLAPANYALTVEAGGFKKVTVGTVVVQVDQITHIELALEVGSVTETVQVEAAEWTRHPLLHRRRKRSVRTTMM